MIPSKIKGWNLEYFPFSTPTKFDKIIFIGNRGVGKTSAIVKYTQNLFNDEVVSEIGDKIGLQVHFLYMYTLIKHIAFISNPYSIY